MSKTVELRMESTVADELPDIRINHDWCKGCGICIAICPEEVYTADRDGKPVIVQGDRCIWCERCETYCPDFAINLVGTKFW